MLPIAASYLGHRVNADRPRGAPRLEAGTRSAAEPGVPPASVKRARRAGGRGPGALPGSLALKSCSERNLVFHKQDAPGPPELPQTPVVREAKTPSYEGKQA